jgi:hypothetical protein
MILVTLRSLRLSIFHFLFHCVFAAPPRDSMEQGLPIRNDG